MKAFNITGTCRPKEHYMVDISDRLRIIREMVVKGDYFCINRGRQYGKTTTLEAIKRELSEDYTVFSISFEGLDDRNFEDASTTSATFLRLLARETRRFKDEEKVVSLLEEVAPRGMTNICELDFEDIVIELCSSATKPIVILIDEVDQAGNNPGFIKFLGVLRNMYLKREDYPTFQSVILAGVYDIKNLKLKMRPEDQHQYNSPWNIAVPFDVDMSLKAEGIAEMLAEYKSDHALDFDEKAVAQLIRDYTSGYPVLVSRICMIIDAEKYSWDKEGVQKAVNAILMERNTLFDNMIKKLDDYPELETTLKRILFSGSRETYNPDEKYLQIAAMFNYISTANGQVTVACRIMETRLYNYFLAKNKASAMSMHGQVDKSHFIIDGYINMQHLLERFVVHMNETYNMDKEHRFLEDNGREIFLTYLRPIINGVGNYYIEPQTRDHERMDIIVDYLGTRYVIELKIWRGNAYNERGEEQLKGYLERFDLQTGYLVSFCFNQKKQSGLLPPIKINGRTLIEAIV
ncbi:MAG: AAA-like domain-containing protein [Prevotellaceae bacterium]|nr:AAA-like domain-containing protein [Candidatus Colivivens caballi]